MNHNSNLQIEKTADRIRDDLLGTLRELDRRRAKATDIRFQVQKHMGALLLTGASALVLLGAAIVSAVLQRRAEKRQRIARRFQAMQRVWNHPERVGNSGKDRPLPLELFRRLTLAAAVALATEAAKRGARQWMAYPRVGEIPHR